MSRISAVASGVLFCLTFSIVAAVTAEPFIDERYSYYNLKGDTAKILLRGIRAERGANGFHAQTNWRVNWQYRWESTSSDCRVANVQIKVDIEYLMPRWLGLRESDNRRLVEVWTRYERALRHHEQGHGDIAIEAGRKVEAALLQLSPRHDCEQLSTDADALAKKIIDQHNQRNMDYDRITDHGATQGATFP